jgi:hypothetical protein
MHRDWILLAQSGPPYGATEGWMLPLAIIMVSLVVIVLVWRLPTTSKAARIVNKKPKPGENAEYWRIIVRVGDDAKMLILTDHEFARAMLRGFTNPEDWQ